MSKNANETVCGTSAWCGGDFLTRALGKVGVSRSLLVTLAVLPFAWSGVAFVKNAVVHVWNFITTAVAQ